ncbi:MAG TPA: 16S rRNA (cytidine(1402)-2'-O)-methyltransferase [Clostridiales bacterium]|nr:16S rRNA (cytidine(1402)-2'-O)-methyltransferase [Clostridiales bacterium]
MSTLYVVATPIGNLGDVSNRQLEMLSACQLILAEDTRHTIKLLNRFNIKTKMISYHKFNEKERAGEIIERMTKEQMDVALVSDAGTPCISDPGFEIVKAARKNGIHVTGIPGCSAVITALSISGMDTSSFVFKGFFPRETKEKETLIEQMTQGSETLYVFYESPKRIVKTAEYLSMKCPWATACFCSDLTKLHEKTITGNVRDVYMALKDDPESELGEYTLIIDISGQPKEESAVEQLSYEAMLVDTMIKSDCTMKDAIAILNKKHSDLSKNDLYKASLNLKNLQ